MEKPCGRKFSVPKMFYNLKQQHKIQCDLQINICLYWTFSSQDDSNQEKKSAKI